MTNKGLSFIIPALNEEAHIGDVLDSVMKNVDRCYKYEMIVVDNGSSDRTVEIAVKKGAVVLHAPCCTISALRNLGALEARYNIFVFIDADVYLVKEWGERIKQVIERLYSQPSIITGSLCGVSEENDWIERIWFAPRTTLKEANYINSGHLIIHKGLFLRVEGFDPHLETGEDCDFCARARRLGARIENDPELKVIHSGYPKSIKRFFTRERWHARGDYKSLKALSSSKPGLVSLANLFTAVTCTIGMAICSPPWFMFPCIYIFFLTSVSLAAAIHRNCGKLDSGIWGIVFLYMIYFTARTVSIADVIIQSLFERRTARASV